MVVGYRVLHGTPAVMKTYRGQAGIVSQPTRPVDIIRTAMMIAGAILALVALYRWGTRDERADDLNPDEEQRRFGDSIVDARTNQDPLIGMTPVRTDPPPRR